MRNCSTGLPGRIFWTDSWVSMMVQRRVSASAGVLAVLIWCDKTHEGHHLGPGLHPLVGCTPQASY